MDDSLRLKQEIKKEQQMEERLNQVCRIADMWTFEVDVPNKLVYTDKHLQDSYHLPAVVHDFPESMIDMDMIHPDYEDVYRNMISDLSMEKPASVVELYARTREGDFGRIRYHWNVAEFENGKPKTVYGYARFIDREEKKNRELQKALNIAEEATRAKSDFLSRMSHEIRTPMNAIMGMTAIAKENRSDFIQVSECLDKIDMSSRFLLTLINDILEMSRIESGNTEIKHTKFHFETLLENIRTVVEPLALKSDIRFEVFHKAEQDAVYYGDSMRIQQVMVNIISNAIKFTKAGGRVRFTISSEEKNENTTNFQFVIADTGIGMSEDFMQKMFQPFTQEDSGTTSVYGGSGLGLAISKSLVESMHGTIQVESFAGVGSTFTVMLPLVRAQESAADEADEKARNKAVDLSVLKGAKVLIAEDHPMNVMIARKLLERKDVDVTVVENGKLAVEAFNQSQPGYYDAILMDIRMPVMDGLDATRNIRALTRRDAKYVPIIAMTANALDEDRQRSQEAGMNEHLAKPFEPICLYNVLAERIMEGKK